MRAVDVLDVGARVAVGERDAADMPSLVVEEREMESSRRRALDAVSIGILGRYS